MFKSLSHTPKHFTTKDQVVKRKSTSHFQKSLSLLLQTVENPLGEIILVETLTGNPDDLIIEVYEVSYKHTVFNEPNISGETL